MGVNKITNRRMGALVGAIVGDLIGIPHEFSHPTAIPTGRLMPTGGGPFNFPPGVGSDDTDLLLIVSNAYDKNMVFDPNAAVDGMLEWFRGNPRDVGNITGRSLSYWSDDIPPPPDEDAQGNGGLMRAAAHGIMGKSMHAAMVNAIDDTRLTHNSRLASEFSGHMATLVWKLIRYDYDELSAALIPRGPFLEEHRKLMRAYAGPVEDPSGWCVHSLRLAKHALEDAENFEDGINIVVRTGGDTDTNASIAGALLGARFGEEGIPIDWVAAIDPRLRNKINVIRGRIKEFENA